MFLSRILIVFAFLFALPVLAVDEHEGATKSRPVSNEPKDAFGCRKAAVKKLRAKAEAQKGVLNEDSIYILQIDDRFLNPYKYVWFAATMETANGTEKVQTLMQKAPFQDCF